LRAVRVVVVLSLRALLSLLFNYIFKNSKVVLLVERAFSSSIKHLLFMKVTKGMILIPTTGIELGRPRTMP